MDGGEDGASVGGDARDAGVDVDVAVDAVTVGLPPCSLFHCNNRVIIGILYVILLPDAVPEHRMTC